MPFGLSRRGIAWFGIVIDRLGVFGGFLFDGLCFLSFWHTLVGSASFDRQASLNGLMLAALTILRSFIETGRLPVTKGYIQHSINSILSVRQYLSSFDQSTPLVHHLDRIISQSRLLDSA